MVVALSFHRLNDGWNADPNVPEPNVRTSSSEVQLAFFLKSSVYQARRDEIGRVTFEGCSTWRLGSTNDEGWFMGQCRYSRLAPAWGEFYELSGQDELRLAPNDWQVPAEPGAGDRHFLFYFRDETFECLAANWRFQRDTTGQ